MDVRMDVAQKKGKSRTKRKKGRVMMLNLLISLKNLVATCPGGENFLKRLFLGKISEFFF